MFVFLVIFVLFIVGEREGGGAEDGKDKNEFQGASSTVSCFVSPEGKTLPLRNCRLMAREERKGSTLGPQRPGMMSVHPDQHWFCLEGKHRGWRRGRVLLRKGVAYGPFQVL